MCCVLATGAYAVMAHRIRCKNTRNTWRCSGASSGLRRPCFPIRITIRRRSRVKTGRRASLVDDFLVRALLAGLGMALLAGPLGSFVVWRRMAYFGDTLAHSALLGVALGFLIGIDLNLGVLAVCTLLA